MVSNQTAFPSTVLQREREREERETVWYLAMHCFFMGPFIREKWGWVNNRSWARIFLWVIYWHGVPLSTPSVPSNHAFHRVLKKKLWLCLLWEPKYSLCLLHANCDPHYLYRQIVIPTTYIGMELYSFQHFRHRNETKSIVQAQVSRVYVLRIENWMVQTPSLAEMIEDTCQWLIITGFQSQGFLSVSVE